MNPRKEVVHKEMTYTFPATSWSYIILDMAPRNCWKRDQCILLKSKMFYLKQYIVKKINYFCLHIPLKSNSVDISSKEKYVLLENNIFFFQIIAPLFYG